MEDSAASWHGQVRGDLSLWDVILPPLHCRVLLTEGIERERVYLSSLNQFALNASLSKIFNLTGCHTAEHFTVFATMSL